MALPTGFNNRPSSSRRSWRFFTSGSVTSTNFDTGWLFTAGGNLTPLPVVTPQRDDDTPDATVTVPPIAAGGTADPNSPVLLVFSGTISISNDGGGDLAFSFDGTNVHGVVKANETRTYRHRFESGIAVKSVSGASVDYRIEAW